VTAAVDEAVSAENQQDKQNDEDCEHVHLPGVRVGGGPGARCVRLLVAAGGGVANLVDSCLCGAFGLVDSPLVVEVSVSGHRAGGFLGATFCLIDVLVGHEPSY
jgi:hypothetical protein